MTEGAFSKTLLRSNIIYNITPPVVHLTAYAAGGYKRLYNSINNQEDLDVSVEDVFTDSEGRFVPNINMPPMARRYKFLDVIGSGQSATIIRTKDLFCGGRQVAVKVLNIHFSQLCAQEADCMRRLNRDDPDCVSGTVRLQTVFSFEGHYCMVFDLLDTVPLHKYSIHTFTPRKRIDSVRQVAASLLKSLGFLQQQNVIHGDLKPDNILLKRKADFSSVTVLDFGNAIRCVHEELSLYYDNFDFQTLLYRAPEVIYGIQFDLEVDMWSYGCILAELYIGKPLFYGAGNKKQILTSMLELLGPLPNEVFMRGKYFGDLECFTTGSHQSDASIRIMNKLGLSDFNFANFLAACLKYDPGKRLTVWEAAQMPFLATHYGYTFKVPPTKQTHSCDKYDGVVSKEAYHQRPRITNPSAKHMSSLELLKHGTQDKAFDNFVKEEENSKVFHPWRKVTGTRKVAQVIPVQRNTPSPSDTNEQQNEMSAGHSPITPQSNFPVNNSMDPSTGTRTLESNPNLLFDPMLTASNTTETNRIPNQLSTESSFIAPNITERNPTHNHLLLSSNRTVNVTSASKTSSWKNDLSSRSVFVNQNSNSIIIKPKPVYGQPSSILQSPKDKCIVRSNLPRNINCESDNLTPSSSVMDTTRSYNDAIPRSYNDTIPRSYNDTIPRSSINISKSTLLATVGLHTSTSHTLRSEMFSRTARDYSEQHNEETMDVDRDDYEEHITNMLQDTRRLLDTSSVLNSNNPSNQPMIRDAVTDSSANVGNSFHSSIDENLRTSFISDREEPVDLSSSCTASKHADNQNENEALPSTDTPETELSSALHFNDTHSFDSSSREITPSPSGSVDFLTSESSCCSSSPKETVCSETGNGISHKQVEYDSGVTESHVQRTANKRSLFSDNQTGKTVVQKPITVTSDECDDVRLIHKEKIQELTNINGTSTRDVPVALNETFTVSPHTSSELVDHSLLSCNKQNNLNKTTGKAVKRKLVSSSFTVGEPRTKNIAYQTEDVIDKARENLLISCNIRSQTSNTLVQPYGRINNKGCEMSSQVNINSSTFAKKPSSGQTTEQTAELVRPKAQRILKPITQAVDPLKPNNNRYGAFCSPLHRRPISNVFMKPSTPRSTSNGHTKPSTPLFGHVKKTDAEISTPRSTSNGHTKPSTPLFGRVKKTDAETPTRKSNVASFRSNSIYFETPKSHKKCLGRVTDVNKPREGQFNQKNEDESDSGNESGPEIRPRRINIHTRSETLANDRNETDVLEGINNDSKDLDKDLVEDNEQVLLL